MRAGGFKDLLWTAPQRAVLLTFVLCTLVVLSIRLACRPHYVSDPQPPEGAMTGRLADRLDPNTATHGALSAIPGIGPSLAQSIITYREEYQKTHPGRVAFTSPADLRRVRGIGVAREENLADYLLFPKPAGSRPAK